MNVKEQVVSDLQVLHKIGMSMLVTRQALMEIAEWYWPSEVFDCTHFEQASLIPGLYSLKCNDDDLIVVVMKNITFGITEEIRFNDLDISQMYCIVSNLVTAEADKLV